MLRNNKIHNMDAITFLKQIDKSVVDLILTDLPYGVTSCDWDKKLNLQDFFNQCWRILKQNGVIILTAVQPFTSELIMACKEHFKYELIWEKSRISNLFTNKKMPSKLHENILVFYRQTPTYNAITYEVDEKYRDKRKSIKNSYRDGNGQFKGEMTRKKDTGIRQPQSVLYFNSAWRKGMHNTEKPMPLFEYLIKSYSNEGDLVLDCCIGSGTTAIACQNTNRNFICNDLSKEWVDKANQRVIENSKCRHYEECKIKGYIYPYCYNDKCLTAFSNTQNSTSFGFPTENSPNISLKTTPSASSKLPTATSLNNNIKRNLFFSPTRKL